MRDFTTAEGYATLTRIVPKPTATRDLIMATYSFGASDSLGLRRLSWGALLTLATVAGTLSLACATPFAALAALAALFLPRRDALTLIAVNWLANQAIGFGLLHYPLTWDCVRGGIELGVACVGCTAAAMLVSAALRRAAFPVTVVAVFVATFASYEALNFVTSLGHHDGDYGISVLLYLLYLNGIAFAGLLALQGMAAALGVAVPRVLSQFTGTRFSAAS